MKWKSCHSISRLVGCFSAVTLLIPSLGSAVNLDVAGGWPCNVWMEQTGVPGAVGNSITFNVQSTPTSSASTAGFTTGAVSDYLVSLGKTFNSLISQLPLLEPLAFNLASESYGARLGVDVCIPAVSLTRDDVLDWKIVVSSAGALIPPAEGDWFSATNPLVGVDLLSSNCNTAAGSPMSTVMPVKDGSCFIESVPPVDANSLNFAGQSVTYNFKLMASREMAFRISLQEQSTSKRPHRMDSGTVQIDFVDSPLPPLLVGDLLGKQLFYAVDTDYEKWPACQNFKSSQGMAFAAMNLQGPNSSLDLRWTGEDLDCEKKSGCSDGNKGGNNFSFPVMVYLEDGTLAPPSVSPSMKVKEFSGIFDDLSFTAEATLPANGRILFQTGFDEVYRSSGKAFFSSTVERATALGLQSCRLWFKRDNGFDCSSLPSEKLQTLCSNML